MVVDSSAFVAVMLHEAREDEFLAAMTGALSLKTSSVTLVETSMVLLARVGQSRVEGFEALLRRLAVVIVPVDEEQARLAVYAFSIYGKGRENKAQLNLGDCFSYALAKHLGEPLLFQGNDFGETDINVA